MVTACVILTSRFILSRHRYLPPGRSGPCPRRRLPGRAKEFCVMSRLPLIVGFGGYNAAGRSSFHHGFRRIVQESLDAAARQETLAGLAVMMKLVQVVDGQFRDRDGKALSPAEIEARHGAEILAGTLVRRIEKRHLDVDAAH